MAQLLLKESCTVTIAHSKTKNIEDMCRKADIVIAAVGKAEIIAIVNVVLNEFHAVPVHNNPLSLTQSMLNASI